MNDALASAIPTLLIFVVGPGVIWWIRRHRPAAGAGLRVTSRTALTKSGVVAVVEADGRRFLVGATDHGMTLLTELDELPDTITDETPEHIPGTGPRKGLIEALREMTVRRPPPPRPSRVHH